MYNPGKVFTAEEVGKLLGTSFECADPAPCREEHTDVLYYDPRLTWEFLYNSEVGRYCLKDAEPFCGNSWQLPEAGYYRLRTRFPESNNHGWHEQIELVRKSDGDWKPAPAIIVVAVALLVFARDKMPILLLESCNCDDSYFWTPRRVRIGNAQDHLVVTSQLDDIPRDNQWLAAVQKC